jgi:hypothetical protein
MNSTQSRSWALGDRRSSDVTVKMLQIQIHGQAPLAVALEVTYHPLSSWREAGPVMGELVAALQGAVAAGAGAAGGRWVVWVIWWMLAVEAVAAVCAGDLETAHLSFRPAEQLTGNYQIPPRLDPLPSPWEEYAASLPPESSPTHAAVLYMTLITAVMRDRGAAAAGAGAGAAGRGAAAAAGAKPQAAGQQQAAAAAVAAVT